MLDKDDVSDMIYEVSHSCWWRFQLHKLHLIPLIRDKDLVHALAFVHSKLEERRAIMPVELGHVWCLREWNEAHGTFQLLCARLLGFAVEDQGARS